jgi:HAD superfamily hydrolase (TIGR01509 family)
MDGLLFDTEALYQRAIAAAAVEGGYDLGSASRLMIGLPAAQSRSLLLELCGPAFPADELLAGMFRHFKRIAATDLSLKPGVVELLDALDGWQIPRAIATSSSHATVEDHLQAHGLENRFNAIVGHGDCTASKPAPDPFLLAAQRLGVLPHLCLALEDSPNGIRSASDAGMMTVMVPDLIEPTDEIRALCSFVAHDLHEVRQAVLDARTGGNWG